MAIIPSKILVLGDLILDVFTRGEASRLSPEAPVPVLLSGETTLSAGGAGNVACNLHALGAQPYVVAPIGTDNIGQALMALIKQQLGDNACLAPLEKWQTPVKWRFIARTQHLMRADWEENNLLPDMVMRQLIQHLTALLPDAKILILSDYAKGSLPETFVAKVIKLAAHAQVPVIVDPKGPAAKYRGATLITPNRHELAQMLGRPLKTLADLREGAMHIAQAIQSIVVVTLGSKGIMVANGEHARHIPAAEMQSVYDVTGAGDTLVAALAASLACGDDLMTALELGNIAAGLVVKKPGTATVTLPEVYKKWQNSQCARGKIMPIQDIYGLRWYWQEQGLTVGFTNGCFDMLHPGHLNLLQEAKAHCDKLIIGLNSDASVQRLKGSHRPLQPQHVRAMALAQRPEVDAVVIFKTLTPYGLIQALRPDVLIKGGDYKDQGSVIGAKSVKQRGGRVIIGSYVQGYSTTSVIAQGLSW
jgi:D-beta-D-heptose 7-phosphate kinase/D-beta-D-heptose 1-phosphate adenosyltransferase